MNTAILSSGGTEPVLVEVLTMLTMRGHRVGRQVLTKEIVVGSSIQVEDFDWVTRALTNNKSGSQFSPLAKNISKDI